MKIFYIWGRDHHGLHIGKEIFEKGQPISMNDGHRWAKKKVV